MIDRIEDLGEDYAVAVKNVTANEPFFQGHFPGYPIMPGVLIAEALAQTGAVLLLSSLPDPSNKLILFAAIDRCKFRRPVFPGDSLRLEVEFVARKRSVSKMKGTALVDGKIAAEALMTCQIIDRPRTESGTASGD